MATVAPEIVYKTKDEVHSMSDKVSQLASLVYTEFKKVIKQYDEDVVKELMPLVIEILENLDLAYLENQEIDVELELIKEDNEQLLSRYEREKQLRKASDQKYLELEDETLDYRNKTEDKVESLESIIRMLEQKNKNLTDHSSRLEEKDSEMKTEYNKVHDRYTELMKTHIDYVERAKFLMGPDRITEISNNTRARGAFHSPNLRSVNLKNVGSGENFMSSWCPPDTNEFDSMFSRTYQECNFSIKSELCNQDSLDVNSRPGIQVVLATETSDKEKNTDQLEFREFATTATSLDETVAHIVVTTPELQEMDESMENSGSTNTGPKTNDVSIYDELDIQDLGDVDYGPDIAENDEDKDERHSSDGDIFFGMSQELENLIHENTELFATKNALNVVKDDLIVRVDELTSEQEIFKEEIMSLKAVKDKLQSRIQSMEEELKKTKEELEKKLHSQEVENEDDVPMAQRKRFTRVEMARVIMERNQYKERLMELQEDVQWTKMIQATKEHPESGQLKKKSSIWHFFSNLFSSPPHQPTKPLPIAMVKYNASTTSVQPVGDPNQTNWDKHNLGDKSKAFDFLQDEFASEKAGLERENERKEQYKQVCAHVKNDDDRVQACGWSLPATFQLHVPNASQSKSYARVPVPVYCGPLLEDVSGIKILCAAGINLTRGWTKDGGSVVGASVFYLNPSEKDNKKNTKVNKVNHLHQELKDHEYNIKQSEQEHLSSFVWICTSDQSGSCVSVIDANHPEDILETFQASTTPILCIVSVPGALESDYPVKADILKAESYPQYPKPMADTHTNSSKDGIEETGIGCLSFVQCVTGTNERIMSLPPVGSPMKSRAETSQPVVFKAQISPTLSGTAMPESSGGIMSPRLINPLSEMVMDGINALASESGIQDEEVKKMSSVLPTVWLGAHSGSLYIHSSVSQWRHCLRSVKLRESILHMVHVKGRVLVALGDGSVAIFHRDSDGQWDVHNYHLLDLGRPHHPIRCMAVIANKHVWCGYRNKIYVLDPQCMSTLKSFDAHSCKESHVQLLAWMGEGVWVSIRLDSTLRLYHAYTHQHLQDVDIEPYISKMLGTGKLGFSFVRITSMLISCKCLWIGTGNGVIISVPLSEGNKQTVSMLSSGSGQPGDVRLYSDNKTGTVTPISFIPYCSMAQTQLSFHGHRDAVKFFVAVPGKKRRETSTTSKNEDKLCGEPNVDKNTRQLVISGGEGYVDFRVGVGDDEVIGDNGEDKSSLSKGDGSHVIVWQVN